MSTGSEIVVMTESQVLEAFSQPNGLEPLLQAIERDIDTFEHDMKTPTSRKKTASFAYSISQKKTKIEAARVGLVSGWKAKAKIVDAEGKRVRDAIDGLRDKAREPLNAWEENEASRIAGHKRGIQEMRAAAIIDPQMPKGATEIRTLIGGLTSVALGDSWEEFQEEAASAKMESLGVLENLLVSATKSEEDAAELDRLKEAEAVRIKKDADDKIEADKKAEEKRIADEAKEAAEKDAKVLKQQAIDAEQKAKEDAEKAEADKIAAKELADKQTKDAAEKARTDEIEKQAKKDKKEADALVARKANIERVTTLKTAAKLALIEAGLPEEYAIIVVVAVLDNKIPNVQFNH